MRRTRPGLRLAITWVQVFLLLTSVIMLPSSPGARAAEPTMLWTDVPESTEAVARSGQWEPVTGASYSGGEALAAVELGASLEYTFTGNGARVLGSRCPTCGQADVFIDGEHVVRLDLNSATFLDQQVLFEQSGLANGTHTVKLVAAGPGGQGELTEAPAEGAETGPRMVIDGFAVGVEQGVPSPEPVPAPAPVTAAESEPGSTLQPSHTGPHPGDPALAPPAPTDLKAVAGDRRVDLTWQPPTDFAATGYRVYRRGGPSKPWTALQAVPLAATEYEDTDVTGGLSYTYMVRTVNEYGTESADSLTVEAVVGGVPAVAETEGTVTEYPVTGSLPAEGTAAPQGLTLRQSGDAVELTWDLPSNWAPAGYRVWMRSEGESAYTLRTADPVHAPGYTDAAPSGTVYYAVTAVGAGGTDSAYSPEAAVTGGQMGALLLTAQDTTAPAIPTGLAVARGNRELTVTWTANTEEDLAGYHIYRADNYGPYQKITTEPVATTTFTNTGLTNGTPYTYAVSAVDATGNESARSAEQTLVPAAPAGFFGRSAAEIVYTGSWGSSGDSSSQGGGHRYSRDTANGGATAELTFFGTGVKWWTLTSQYAGKVEVYIDGSLVKTVDTWQSYTEHQKAFEITKLNRNVHRVLIKVTGTKNPSAGDHYAYLEGFEVIDSDDNGKPAPPAGLTTVAESGIVYLQWTPNADDDFYAYNVYRSEQPASGFVRLNPWTLRHGTTFVDTTAQNGVTYYYHITALDHAGNESDPGTTVSAEPLAPPAKYQEESRGMVRTGSWEYHGDGSADGGAYRRSKTASDTASITFHGTGVSWTTIKHAWAGTAQVFLDGQSQGVFDLYSGSTLYKETVFQVGNLPEGEHTLEVVVTGQKNASSYDSWVTLDAFEVTGTVVPRAKLEQTSQVIDYHGRWWSAWDGDTMEHNAAGNTLTYTFYGTGIDWLVHSNHYSGKALVTINSEPPVMIDLYRSSDTRGWTAFRRRGLAPGQHTIKVEVLGQRHPTSNGTYVPVDGFVVYDMDEAVPSAPSISATAGAGSVTVSWSSPRADVVGYNVYRMRGAILDGKTNYPRIVRTTSFTDEGLMPGVAYTYLVTAVSGLGNESVWSAAASATPTAPAPAAGYVSTAGTYENSDTTHTAYSTGWSTSSTGAAYGGSYAYANAENEVLTFTFSGSGFRWIAPYGPYGGMAEVYVDGVLQGTVDLWSGSDKTLWKQVLYEQMHLVRAEHTVQIKVTGRRSSGSWGSYVYHDRFEVVDDGGDASAPAAPAGAAVERGNTTVRLTWAPNAESDLYGYRVYRATDPAGPYTLLKSGLPNDPAGIRPGDMPGAVRGTVAGQESSYVDRGLSNGTAYYYLVTAVDQYGNESGPPAAVSIVPAAMASQTVLQENDGSLVWSGTWESYTDRAGNSHASGGNFRKSNDDAATVKRTFTGSTVRWIGMRSPYGGIAEVYLDGVLQGTVDQYAAATEWQAELYSAEGLDLAVSHTLEIRNTGTKHASALDDYLFLDAVEVLPAHTQQNDPGVVYTGSWSHYGNGSASGGAYSQSDQDDAKVSLTFAGTGIRWVGLKSPYGGIVEVTLTDEAGTVISQKTIDQWDSNTLWQIVHFQKLGLSAGKVYTIELRNAGKNSSAYGDYIFLDAIEVLYSTDVTAPAVPLNLAAYSESAYVELNWSHSTETDLAGYYLERSADGGATWLRLNEDLPLSGRSTYIDTGMANGITYQYRVIAADVSGNESPPSAVAAIRVAAHTGKYQEESRGVVKTGTWEYHGDGSADGGAYRRSKTASDTASITFFGTGIRWIGFQHAWAGKAEVFLNGESKGIIDLYSASTVYKPVSFELTGLAEGIYTLEVVVLGQKQTSSYDSWVTVDAFEVEGAPLPARVKVEDTSQAIDYTGRWWRAWDNTTTEHTTAGNALSYTFDGTGVELIVNSTHSSGKAWVSLNNEPPALVDLYRPSDTWGWKPYRRVGLPLGLHTIRVEPAGTKNPSSSNTYIPVEGFAVIGADETVPPAPSISAAAGAGSVTVSWNSPRADVVGYNVYRMRGAILDGKANYPRLVRGTSFTDDALAQGTEYTYAVTAISGLGLESEWSVAASATPTAPLAPPDGYVGAPGEFENSAAGITYSSGWSTGNDANAFGSSYAHANSEGASASFSFSGTSVKWVSILGPYAGIAEVFIDGQHEATLDLWNRDVTIWKAVVFEKTHLPQGSHTIEVRVAGRRNSASWGTYVYLDQFAVGDDPEAMAPLTPTGLVIVKGNTTATLTWTANTETDLSGYRIYRSTSETGPFKVVSGRAPHILGSTTFTDTGLLNGQEYHYLVVAVDKNGNESAGATASVVTDAGPGQHQEDDLGWVRTGTWNRYGNGKAFGGHYNQTNEDIATATIIFNGSGVRWYPVFSPYNGIIDVYIDGVKEATVDLYHPEWRFHWIGFEKRFTTSGTHTLELRNTGTRNPSAWDDYNMIDSVEVFDTADSEPPAAPYALRIVPGVSEARLFWTVSPEQDFDGYRIYRATAAAGPFQQVSAERQRFADRGSTTFTQHLKADGNTYYYQVRAVDRSGNESLPSNTVSMLSAAPGGSWQNNWSGLTYAGTGWAHQNDGNSEGGTHHTSKTAGDTVSISFKGTGIRWKAVKGPYAGIAEVSLDGSLVGTVDLYASGSWVYKQVAFENLSLADGVHTLAITVTGQKNASSGDAWVYLDAFEVVGETPTEARARVEETNYAITYKGLWSANCNSAWSAGCLTYTQNADTGLVYQFYGTGIDLVANRGQNDGLFRIFLNNEPVIVTDQYQYYSGAAYQHVFYRRRGLPLGLHTIRLERLGVKNVNGESANFNLDAFDVIDPDTALPDPPTNLAAQVGVYHATVSWSQPNPDVVGYNIYRRHGVYERVKLNEYIWRSTSFRSDGLSPNTTYYFTVKAVDALGNESDYATEVAVTTGAEGSAPPAPVGVASMVVASGIQVSWAESSTALDHYTVYRATSATGPWSMLAHIPYGTQVFTDSQVVGGTTYHYQVTAVSTPGQIESAPSSTVQATAANAVSGTVAPEFGSREGVQVGVVNSTLTATSDDLGGWAIEGLTDGTWTLRFTRPGYLTVTVDVFVQFGTAEVAHQTLKFGDIDGDGAINLADLQRMMTQYGKDVLEWTDPLAEVMDVVADGFIDLYDLFRLARNISPAPE